MTNQKVAMLFDCSNQVHCRSNARFHLKSSKAKKNNKNTASVVCEKCQDYRNSLSRCCTRTLANPPPTPQKMKKNRSFFSCSLQASENCDAPALPFPDIAAYALRKKYLTKWNVCWRRDVSYGRWALKVEPLHIRWREQCKTWDFNRKKKTSWNKSVESRQANVFFFICSQKSATLRIQA